MIAPPGMIPAHRPSWPSARRATWLGRMEGAGRAIFGLMPVNRGTLEMKTSPAEAAVRPDGAGTGDGDLELSVVMPCLNEARTVGCCIDKAWGSLRALGLHGEVIIADNGSTDGSREIAAEHGARVVPVSRRGYGYALRAGIEAARGRHVIMGDADDSYDFTRLEPFVGPLREGYDLVMGNRFRGGILPGAMPWHHRYIGNPILTGILNLFYRTPIGDAHCGLRGFRRDSYMRLGIKTTGMEFASEMVVKAAMLGQKITEVPIVLHPDGRDRPPHLRSFRDGWRHLRFLLILCPFWLYLMPAGGLLCAGLSLMAWLTPGPRVAGSAVLDLHTMLMGCLCVILGYQLVWLWAYAKIHGWLTGLLPATTFNISTFKIFNLEIGCIVGLVAVAIGLLLDLSLVWTWAGLGYGPLNISVTMRYAIWAFLLIVLGGQTVFGSFFLSMLGMSRQSGE